MEPRSQFHRHHSNENRYAPLPPPPRLFPDDRNFHHQQRLPPPPPPQYHPDHPNYDLPHRPPFDDHPQLRYIEYHHPRFRDPPTPTNFIEPIKWDPPPPELKYHLHNNNNYNNNNNSPSYDYQFKGHSPMSPYHRRGGEDGNFVNRFRNNDVVDDDNNNNNNNNSNIIVADHSHHKKILLFGEPVDVKKDNFLWAESDFYQGNYRTGSHRSSRVSLNGGVGIEESTGNFGGLVPSSSSSQFTFGKGRVFGNENVKWGTEKLQKRGQESLTGDIKWGSAKLEKRGEFGSVGCKPSVSMEREEMGSERRFNDNVKWGSAKLEKRGEICTVASKPSVSMEKEDIVAEHRFNSNVKWGSVKLEKIGEFGSVVCEPSVSMEREEMGSKSRLSDKSYRGFGEKRLYNESRSGKVKNVESREELQEFGYSPKAKVQRTSALLRVGKTPTKWKDQETLYFKKHDGPSIGSFTHRGPLEFPDEKPEQGKTESSVDLDVSFKSNALVAKAVVPPSDHVVGSDETSTPNNNKKRKVVAPLLSGSSPRVIEVREKSSKQHGSLQNSSAAASSKKRLVRSKDKATRGRIGSAGGIGFQPCRDKNIVPLEKNAIGRTPSRFKTSFEKKKLNIDKLPKHVDVSSNSDKVLLQSEDQVSVSGIGTTLGIGSQPRVEQVTMSHKKSSSVHNNGLTQSEDEAVIDGIGSGVNFDTQPSLNETDAPLGQCYTEKTPLCSTGSSDKKPLSGNSSPQSVDAVSASSKGLLQSESIIISFGMENGDITGSQLCLSASGKIPLSKKPSSDDNLLNGGNDNQNLDVASRFDKFLCLTHSKDEVSVARLGTADVIDSHSCLNGITVLPDTTVSENYILETPVGADNKLLHGDGSIQKVDAASGFDNSFCLTDSNDKIASVGLESVDGIGFHPNLNGKSIPVETSLTGNSPSKIMVGTSEKLSNSTQKSAAASKVLMQLKNEPTVSGVGIGDRIGSGACLSGITMRLEASTREKTPLSTTFGFDKKPPNCDSSTSKSEFAFSSTKSLTQAMDKDTISGVRSGNTIDDQPLQNGIATPLDMSITVKTPLGSEVGSDLNCAPKIKKRKRQKYKKLTVLDSDLPAPVVYNASVPVTSLPAPVTEVFRGVACRDRSGNVETADDVCLYPPNNVVNTSLENRGIVAPHLNTFSFSVSEVEKSDNNFMQSEEKAAVSVIGSTVGLNSDKGNSISLAFEKNSISYQKAKLLSSPLGSAQRRGKSEMKRLAAEHGRDVIVASEASMSLNRPEPLKQDLRYRRKRSRRSKRKDMEHSLGLSSPPLTETHHESVTASSSGHGADCTLSSDMGFRLSEEPATASDDRTEIVDMQAVHRITDLDEIAVTKSLLSPVVGSGDIPKVDMKTVFDNLSGLSTSRLTETHDEPTTADQATYFLDASTNSENGTRVSEKKNTVSGSETIDDVDLQSLPGITAMHGNSVTVKSFPKLMVAAAHKTRVKKKIKKKRELIPSILSLRNCEETGQYFEPKNSLSCNDGTDAPLISDAVQKNSEEEVIVPSIRTVDAVGNLLSLENCLEQRSPMNVVSVRNGVDEDDRSSARPNINYSSSAEELTLTHGHSPTSLADGDDCIRDIIESRIGEGESPIDLDAAGQLGLLGREKCEDIPLQLSEEGKLSFLPLELQISALNERSMTKVMEDDIYGFPVKDELPFVSTSVTPREEASGTSIINCNEEGADSVFERLINTDDQQSLFTTQDLSPHFQFPSSVKKRCRDGGPAADPEGCANLAQTTQPEYVISKKTLFSSSFQKQELTSTLKPKAGEMIGRKIFQSPPVTKVFSGPASFSSHYNKSTDSSTRTARPRTWHRTGNTLPLPQKVSGLSTVPSERLPLKKIQSTSYIRKGNSLVRKCVLAATSPQVSAGLSTASVQLNCVGSDESKGSAASDHKVNCLDPPNYLRPSIEGGSCKTSDLAYKNSANHIVAFQNHNDVSKDSETQGILDNGKSQSSKMKGITYVKHKSNQFVASCNTEVDGSSSIAENTQTLHSSAPYDQYYKKSKNQLIRNATSLGSHLKQALSIPNDILNSDGQRASKASFLKGIRNISRRKLDKAFVKTGKSSKFSLVWTLNGEQTHKDTSSLQRHTYYPNLFPWKKATQWRNFKCNLISSKNSFLRIGKTLLLSRKRDSVYTRSTGGFSLRKSKVLSIGGSNLKWSKSIESRSKKANEEATLAVAAVEKKKREQKGTGRAVTITKRRNNSSRERIFRIGSVRYKMDSSKRTLQRIPDENLSCVVDIQSGKGTSNSFIPKRLLIDNNEYIRIGNGNQLVRDPKKLVRLLASEKIRWSLHTARLRLARKQQYCQFFTRFGKCNKDDGKCPYIHDPAKIAVCTKFLKDLCSNPSCKLTHKVIPERMPDCSYFLQGLCTNESCPYRHVNVNPNAPVCEGFLRGYCASGNECCKKHSYVCPVFSSTGVCPQGSMCKLHHPKKRNKTTKQAKISGTTLGRYFGSKLNYTGDTGIVASDKRTGEKSEDIFTDDTNELADYISIDVSDEECQDSDNPIVKCTKFYDSEPSDIQSDERHEFILPVRLICNT